MLVTFTDPHTRFTGWSSFQMRTRPLSRTHTSHPCSCKQAQTTPSRLSLGGLRQSLLPFSFSWPPRPTGHPSIQNPQHSRKTPCRFWDRSVLSRANGKSEPHSVRFKHNRFVLRGTTGHSSKMQLRSRRQEILASGRASDISSEYLVQPHERCSSSTQI